MLKIFSPLPLIRDLWEKVSAFRIGIRWKVAVTSLAVLFLVASCGMVLEYGSTPTSAPAISAQNGAPVGTTTVLALRDSIQREIDRGWVPNDLLWPRLLLPFRNYFQQGEWETWQQATYNLKFRISREGRSDRIDPHLVAANSAINNDATKWWFPSAERKMRETVGALDAYLAALPERKNFHPRANSLYELIDSLSSTMGGSIADLTDSQNIGWLQGYAPFYYAKGEAYATLIILQAVRIDFADVLATKHGSDQQLDKAISWLQEALLVDPWFFPLNGELGPNDLAVLASKLSQAQQELGPLADTLRNG